MTLFFPTSVLICIVDDTSLMTKIEDDPYPFSFQIINASRQTKKKKKINTSGQTNKKKKKNQLQFSSVIPRPRSMEVQLESPSPPQYTQPLHPPEVACANGSHYSLLVVESQMLLGFELIFFFFNDIELNLNI